MCFDGDKYFYYKWKKNCICYIICEDECKKIVYNSKNQGWLIWGYEYFFN